MEIASCLVITKILLAAWSLLSAAEWFSNLHLFRPGGLLSWNVLGLRPALISSPAIRPYVHSQTVVISVLLCRVVAAIALLVGDAKAIVEELRKYDEALYEKPRWLVLNKVDLLPENEREKTCKKFIRSLGWKGKSFIISAISGEGCEGLVYAIMDYLEQESAKQEESSMPPVAAGKDA